jgi:Spy/CpxP family protein refolding chaperone
MRKLALFAAFAASLGGAAALHAQTPAPSDTTHRTHEGRGGRSGRGGPAMMDQMLLKNITLTDAQKAQLEKVRKSERASMQNDGGTRRGDFDAIRKARQAGDTATARKLMAEQRTRMDAHLTAHAAAIRAILTPDQQKQLDANAADLKTHPMQLGRGGRGGGKWNGQRSPAI